MFPPHEATTFFSDLEDIISKAPETGGILCWKVFRVFGARGSAEFGPMQI